MGKKTDKIKNSVSEVLELPKDIILDMPRITMIGNMDIHIENHKGILEYGDEVIKVKTKDGFVKVEGVNMVIKSIVNEEIIISGKIHRVEFFD